MINRLNFTLFTILISLYASAQVGGSQVFSFLNVAPSGFSHSLGGTMISTATSDISTALQNPATLNEETRNAISFNHLFNTSGISSGYFSYGNYWKKRNLEWHSGIQYTNYGSFQGADEWGNRTTEFKAADYAFLVGINKHLNEKFSIGVNTKFIYSRLEDYLATGLGFDIGGFYSFSDNTAGIGLVAKNLGFVMRSYNQNGGLLPFDLQLGFSKKLKHLPFRYTVTGHHLYTWDIRYDDPALVEDSNPFGETNEPSVFTKSIDNFFRHLIFGGEFLLGKKENLKLRFAYNHMLRSELNVNNLRGITGFSGGVEFKIKQFFIGYSFGLQHLHGSTKQLSITTNFGKFKKK